MSHLTPIRATIFLIFLASASGISWAEFVPSAPAGASGSAILVVDLPSGVRILEELEMCRGDKDELTTLRRLDEKNTQLDEIRVEREALLRERIAFLERQQAELLRMNDAAIRQADIARKSKPWYQEALDMGKWVGLGILLGFVAGAGK